MTLSEEGEGERRAAGAAGMGVSQQSQEELES